MTVKHLFVVWVQLESEKKLLNIIKQLLFLVYIELEFMQLLQILQLL